MRKKELADRIRRTVSRHGEKKEMDASARGNASVYTEMNKGSYRKLPGDTIENVDMNMSLCAIDFAEDAIRRLASAL